MKPNFQKFLTRKHALLTDDILVRAWNDKKRFKKLSGLDEYVKNLEIIDGDFCFDKNWMDEIEKKYKNKDLKFFNDFIKEGIVHGEKLKKFARNLKIENKDFRLLKKDFWKSVELLSDLLVFLPETHPLAKIIEGRTIEVLRSKEIKNGNIQDALLKISYPRKLNSPALEQVDLLKINNEFREKTKFDLDEAIKKHTMKYAFLGYREPFSKGYPYEFFKKRLKELLDNGFLRGDALSELGVRFSNTEKKIIGLMQDFVYFRNYRTEKLYEDLYYLEPLWLKLGRHCGLKNSIDFGYYLLDEVEKLLNKDVKINNAIIEKRKAGYGVLLHSNKIKFIIGDALRKKKLAKVVIKEIVKEIKGMTACKGIAIGSVKVILKASEQNKIKKGDILVTSMTTPDFMPGMKKAAAFITDEGGITCHAAIVAREMNKPCIIGAKIATKILKDGDLVEVDADRGVVKILKKTK